MRRARCVRRQVLPAIVLIASFARQADAQTITLVPARQPAVEVTAFGGYGHGIAFDEAVAAPFDVDGTGSVGAVVDVFIDRGRSITVIYTHQETSVDAVTYEGDIVRRRIAVDRWHLGGTVEVDSGPVRPFYQATVGLTRFTDEIGSEVRFSAGGGGGVKLMPSDRVGVRFDGRLYAVLVDGSTGASFCSPGVCLVGLRMSVAWQAEFAAGLVVSF
jgi:hypothetical protein